jgi:hypothetical protein
METRALAIALFYAIGTAVGGITGPLLFGQLIHSGNADHVATGFFVGAAAMALGGLAELLFGVRAEQQSLEDIAEPLTAAEAEAGAEPGAPPAAPETREYRERADRVQRRSDARHARDSAGARRFRPGPGRSFYSPGMVGTAGTTDRYAAMGEYDLDREIELLAHALAELGMLERDALASRVGAAGWGPGRFDRALREAVEEGRVSRHGQRGYSSADAGGTAPGAQR